MFEIRGPSGFGDAIYVNCICRELLKTHDRIKVRTKYPDVFKYLKNVEPIKFTKGGADLEFNYGGKRRADQSTTQWQDLLINSKQDTTAKMCLTWELTNTDLADQIKDKANGKKILIFSIPHKVFDRLDNFGVEMIPDYRKFSCVLDYAKSNNLYIIQIGKGNSLHNFNQIDLRLENKTTISDMMDMCTIGDVFFGQCGFIIPMAEGVNKPLFIILARRGLQSRKEFLSNITGKKVLSNQPTSVFAVDDYPDVHLVQEFEKCL